MQAALSPAEIIETLGMRRHPEGGWYAETFRDAPEGGRGASTAIYFLLSQGEVSAWHRVLDAAEAWHFYAGSTLELSIAALSGDVAVHRLGPDLLAGERPQAIVPAGHWQKARSRGDWTLVGCTVAPGFEFSSFELAPPGWEPA
jgi:predicted cupin superfamily sugar epimerase